MLHKIFVSKLRYCYCNRYKLLICVVCFSILMLFYAFYLRFSDNNIENLVHNHTYLVRNSEEGRKFNKQFKIKTKSVTTAYETSTTDLPAVYDNLSNNFNNSTNNGSSNIYTGNNSNSTVKEINNRQNNPGSFGWSDDFIKKSNNINSNYIAKNQLTFDMQNISKGNYNCIIEHVNVHTVEPLLNETFLQRMKQYNDYISKLRTSILVNRSFKSWQDIESPNKLTVLWGRDDDFINKLLIIPNIKIIVLPWIKHQSHFDIFNVLYPYYYKWSASDPLCQWIETEGFTKAHWDAVYGKECSRNINDSALPSKLEFLYFHSKPVNKLHYWPNDGLSYPSYFFKEPPPYILYLTIIEDAVVNLVGDVISGGYKIVPFTCSHDNIPTIPIEYPESTIYKEVFVITQFWGTSYFHKLVEVMPRIAPYIKFLKKNKQIMIHVPEERGQVSELLNILGINVERIITGIVRAKIVYLPQGTPCGFPQVQSIQLLSHHLKSYLYKTQPKKHTVKADMSLVVPKQLLLIQRSGQRHFRHQRGIENALQKFCDKNNIKFVIFGDHPVPSLPESISLFHSSSIVIAPHGAGLSNIMFCKQGSVIIEGVCNPPHVNMCYQFISHVLGMRYHGIPSVSGCEAYIDVDPETIINVLESFLNVL